jgi:4-carboxymuconolactone decarboxylase
MARLQDPIESLSGEDRRIYDEMLAKRKRQGTGLYGPYTVLMHHPVLAQHIEQLGYYFKFRSELPRGVYQFVVLSFAHRVGSEFEWQDHQAPALTAGLSSAVIDAVASGAEVPEPYATAQRVIDAAMSYADLSNEIQREAIERFGTKGLLEIVTLCGFYAIIAQVNSVFDVPLGEAGRATASDRGHA